MRYSKMLIPTVKEAPAEAISPSHVLLLRGGYIRKLGAGIYNYLPLGHRVLSKVARIVREEMNRAGAQEVLMPAVLPAELWQETGRWDAFGDVLLRFKDRKGTDFCLGPTHEEIITDMVRREVRSYRQLPVNLYQIQTKFRDEARPRGGLLRTREFLMKDAYSFDVDDEGAARSFAQMREAYERIFTRCGLTFRIVSADSGAMGGSMSAEFQILAETGEDAIVACDSCDYAANVEVAQVALPQRPAAPATLAPLKKVPTPGKRTIEEVSTFLGVAPQKMLKTLIYVAGQRVVTVVVRGDHEVNEVKLARALGMSEVFLATDADVVRATGAPVGFAGPVGMKTEVYADQAVQAVFDGVTGANEAGAHYTGVNPGRDFAPRWADLRSAGEGDPCPRCSGHYKAYRGIEGGHIFILGTHYSAKMKATYLDAAGVEKPIVMGCYGIGVSRIVAAAIEQHHDADGIRWPLAIAPFEVLVTSVGASAEVRAASTEIYEALSGDGFEVLWDDREERPGVKFKDADLIGIPIRVTVGERGLKEGVIEVKRRDQKEAARVTRSEAVALVAQMVRRERG
ncbi:MAG: proline--tRNA ligase [Deltaproteobacteria bacterium]|nr:proline--tRNA ligase [Deltaproteobacteria bacterium]